MVGQAHAGGEAGEVGVGRHAFHQDPVFALVGVAGVEQAGVQPGLVGEQEQAFAVGVEATERIYPHRQARGEVGECFPGGAGLGRELREDAVRFVKGDEHAGFCLFVWIGVYSRVNQSVSMRAILLTAVNQLEVREVPDPAPAADEVVVRIAAAALNHRDVWIKLGQYAGLKFPSIPGSDGVGEVVAVGSAVAGERWLGRRVIVNPSFGWGAGEAAQGADFSILGLPRDGTLAEKIAVPAAQLAEAPAHLGDAEAAALPLAGLTAWRALMTRAGLRAGERVLIGGIGGGTAVFALQFAVAAGAEVWVTSSSAEKIARARALGARGGFDYTAPDWAKAAGREAGGLFDVIIDSAGGKGFEALVDLAAPGARIAFFGATRGNPPVLPMRKLFWRQLSLLGTTMGSPADWTAMLDAVSRHGIRPVVGAEFSFARATEAFELMERGGQFGKIVLMP